MKAPNKFQIVAVTLMLGLGLSSFSVQAERNDSHKGNKKEYKYKKNDRQKYANKSYKYDDHRYYDRKPVQRHYENERYAYRHPRYGNVYRQFSSAPVHLRHTQGDVYYHSGHYYSYYPQVGYVQIAMPSGYVFATLPGRYERVHYGGHLYFRVGDMMFERCGHGYRLAPQFNVSFSARF
ncbi:hypothetical protein [Mangrovibacterium diazotrophicum]|uniref:Nickel/cobalt transporter regulator n=1 Tax=Mangrovibacterium diazotrophicum TaxID=1261403 RepID=A0A419VZI3_9BACT|nr:hypothetical protein [Mangrovibacterium diazotrophicum]RKD88470.1 hypothetical protein BC643_3619 [Mangrovibacterium diazotrophicum]